MEAKDLISIVIPAYNRAHCIGRTIESCLVQSYTNIEIIICDDHSTDNTVNVVDKYVKQDKRVILIEDDLGKGAQYARECGIRKASGKYIAFMDSDDYMIETSIEDRYKCFLKNDVDMVYGDILVDSKPEPILVKYDNLNNCSLEEIQKYCLEELSLCAFITMMVKKSLFDEGHIVLDKSLPAWQDDDLALSICFYSGKIFHCGKPVAKICVDGDNISAHYSNKLKGLKLLFNKYENQIKKRGKYRVYLWKKRIKLDEIGVKMQKQMGNNKFLFLFYKIHFALLNRFLSTQFRHIYG